MTRTPEATFKVSEENIQAVVRSRCNSEMQCELRTEENLQVLDKIKKEQCGKEDRHLNVFVGYSPKHNYYAYCGALQPKVHFFTKTSFYNDLPKVRNIPFTVIQDTKTRSNFNLKIEDPSLKYELCLFSIKTGSNISEKCDITKDDKCYKYCYGETVLVDSTKSDAVSTTAYDVNITTRYGTETFKVISDSN